MATTTTANIPFGRSQPDEKKKLRFVERDIFFVLFSLAHIPLGILMELSTLVSTVHAAVTLLVGLYILSFRRSWTNILLYTGYVVGVEVLWRTSDATIFWESGKYLIIFMLGMVLLIYKRSTVPFPALLFFLMLTISAPTMILSQTFDEMRSFISYNLSGPLLISVGLIVFSNFSVTDKDFLRLCRFMLVPIFGLSAAVLSGVLRADALFFPDESNPLFSAGFGPNQVSAILGLGAALAFILALNAKLGRPLQIFYFAVALVMLVQAILTFSRGGVLLAIATIGIASVLLLRVQNTRAAILLVMALAPIFIFYILLPQINEFTGGVFETRFTDMTLTGRDDLIEGDMLAFRTYPLFGVGPGGSEVFHSYVFRTASRPHTEYTRILAEHGLIGAAAMALLAVIVVINFFSKRTPLQFGLLLAFAMWGFGFLAVNGFRLAAPAYMIGLSALGTLVPPDVMREETSE